MKNERLLQRPGTRPSMAVSAIVALLALFATALTGCGGGDDGDVKAFCEKESSMDQAMESLGDDPEAIQAGVTILEDLADVAPSEIKGDVESIATAFQGMADASAQALELSESDPNAALDLITESLSAMEGLQTAGENVEDFVNENC